MSANVKLRCRSCKHEVPVPPQKCPRCGGEMVVVKPRWQPSPVIVIILLFLVLGPFALGMLWRNDRFSRNAKWVLTALVIIYTAAMVWYVLAAVQQATTEVDKALDQMQF